MKYLNRRNSHLHPKNMAQLRPSVRSTVPFGHRFAIKKDTSVLLVSLLKLRRRTVSDMCNFYLCPYSIPSFKIIISSP